MDLENAIQLAVQAHMGQKDKSGQPYILHPLRVMFSLKDFYDEMKIVAVLHDVIEDTQVTPALLRTRGFSELIVEAVIDITHLKNEPYIEYLERVRRNPISKAVKVAVIADNMAPDRLAALDLETQERLINKYNSAMQFLTGKGIWTSN